MFKITTDTSNKDIPEGMNRHEAREYYLSMWNNFSSKIDRPVIEKFEDKYVLRADLAPGGLKSFGAERLIAESAYDTLVYCVPRQGHAPDAIAMLAEMYNKKCVFFYPSCKVVSDHQGALFAYPHLDARFIRIASIRILNIAAKRWAERNNAQFLPFGLKDSPIVTAGLVNMADMITKDLGHEPTQVWCAVSTGTMIRAMQIGWPNATAHGIAVARNMHKGEIGEAHVTPATMPFLTPHPRAHQVPFPTTAAYDAKAWEAFKENAAPGSIFMNVGSDLHIERNLSKVDVASINSAREWKDMGDTLRNRAFDDRIEIIEIEDYYDRDKIKPQKQATSDLSEFF